MGGRSRAAAQLLAGKGFREVYNLKGGIKAWEGQKAAGPAEIGISLLKGDETPQQVIALAYGMEEGLREFYSIMAEISDDPEVVNLYTKLTKLEEVHKLKLFDLYMESDTSITDKKAFEANIVSDVMEGGFTTQDFLEQNKELMSTVTGALSIAMMLEAQALDLYMRYSEKAREPKSRAVFYDIAEEEKVHLDNLGLLMEEKTKARED